METGIKEFFDKNDQFARHSGCVLLEAHNGFARGKMEIQPFHFNGMATVHGGAIFTLADYVFAAAGNSHGTAAVAVNVSITYMKAARTGTLYAEARELSRNPKLASYTINVTDDDGDLIAVFQGMVYRKKDPIPPRE